MATYLLHAEATLSQSPATYVQALEHDLRGVLRESFGLPRDEPDAQGRFDLALPVGSGTGAQAPVRAHCGLALAAAGSCHATVHWRADPGAPAGDFDGVFSVEPDREGRTRLQVVGQCLLGEAAEASGGEADLSATLQWLADRLQAALERYAGTDAFAGAPRRPKGLLVADLVSEPSLVLEEDLPLRAAVLLLLGKGLRGAPVTGARGEVVGVLTESDLLAREASPRLRRGGPAREEDRRRRAETVGEACSRPALTIAPQASARTAARELLDHDVSMLVVVEGAEVVGVLTRHDVLRTLTRGARELQQVVDRALSEAGVSGARAIVTGFGHVGLEGQLERRSDVHRATSAVAAVDGVSDVRTEHLTWVRDDLAEAHQG